MLSQSGVTESLENGVRRAESNRALTEESSPPSQQPSWILSAPNEGKNK